jgi:hypothetical protein
MSVFCRMGFHAWLRASLDLPPGCHEEKCARCPVHRAVWDDGAAVDLSGLTFQQRQRVLRAG